MVLLLDADFLVAPPSWVRGLLHNRTRYQDLQQLLQQRALLVLPALRDIDNPDFVPVQESKEFIIDLVQRARVHRYYQTCTLPFAQATARHMRWSSFVRKSSFRL